MTSVCHPRFHWNLRGSGVPPKNGERDESAAIFPCHALYPNVNYEGNYEINFSTMKVGEYSTQKACLPRIHYEGFSEKNSVENRNCRRRSVKTDKEEFHHVHHVHSDFHSKESNREGLRAKKKGSLIAFIVNVKGGTNYLLFKETYPYLKEVEF